MPSESLKSSASRLRRRTATATAATDPSPLFVPPQPPSEGKLVPRTAILRRTLAVTAAAAAALALAGCGDAPRTPTGGLAIVVGDRSNSELPSLDGAAGSALQSALDEQSYLAVVVADGAPFIAQQGPLLTSGQNPVARKEQRAVNEARVAAVLKSAKAKTPENDLVGALTLGARSIHDTRGHHTIVVLDS